MVRLEAQMAMMPHASWAVACPLVPGYSVSELSSVSHRLSDLGFRHDAGVSRRVGGSRQRGRCGDQVNMRGNWQLWFHKPPPKVRALAEIDLTPPTEEEVSLHEKKVREAAKWEPIHLRPSSFRDLHFPLQVQQWVLEGVRVPFRGDRTHFQEVPQYPWKSMDMMEAAAVEADRMMACGALVRPPPGVQVTLVSPWVVVLKGGKTRCCLGLHELLNPLVPSVPFSLPQFADTARFIRPEGYMAAFDLRDFFFALHIHLDDIGLFGTREHDPPGLQPPIIGRFVPDDNLVVGICEHAFRARHLAHEPHTEPPRDYARAWFRLLLLTRVEAQHAGFALQEILGCGGRYVGGAVEPRREHVHHLRLLVLHHNLPSAKEICDSIRRRLEQLDNNVHI